MQVQQGEAQASLRASVSEEDIKASYSAAVMRDATVIDVRQRKDAAIRLRDAGKLDDARKAFNDNVQQITEQAAKYGFKVDGILAQEQASNSVAASPAAASPQAWIKQRKIMRGQDANQSGSSMKY